MLTYLRTSRILEKSWAIFLAFLLLTFLLRSASFFQSVIDWDEGVYLLMSQAILNGHPPYTTIWDNKPPGIYILYALAQLLWGNNILSIRLIGWIAVSISSWLLYRLGVVISKGDKWVGLLAGLLYTVFSLNSQGLSSNTEIFFAPFVILAFFLLISSDVFLAKLYKRDSLRFFAIGLFVGIGFEIKYVVVFDFLAILLIITGLLFSQFKHDPNLSFVNIISYYVLTGIGFILPFAFVSLYFIFTDRFNLYVNSNIVANIINSTDTDFSLILFLETLKREVSSNMLLWLSCLLAPFYLIAIEDIDQKEKNNVIALLIWLVMAFLGVCFTKLFYSHYFLQLLAPMSLLSALLIVRIVWSDRGSDLRRPYFILVLVLLGPLVFNAVVPLGRGAVYTYYHYVKGVNDWGDEPLTVSLYLREHVDENDYIYSVDYQPTIYFMVPAKIPTRFAFPPFLIDDHFAKIAGIDPVQELRNIMAKKPVYVIKQYQDSTSFYQSVDSYLQNDYFLECTINNVKLYRLRSDFR